METKGKKAAQAVANRGSYGEITSIVVQPTLGCPYDQRRCVYRGAMVPGATAATTDPVWRTKWGRAVKHIAGVLADLDGSAPKIHKSPRADEHGAWSTGCSFDKKGRGEAVSVDLYGVLPWQFPSGKEQPLAVIQVRQAVNRRGRGKGFLRVRKDYYLIGRNENQIPFAHPVSYAPVRAAASSPTWRASEDPGICVRAALAWIWDTKPERLDLVLRHGDVAIIPAARERPPKFSEEDIFTPCAPVQIIDSHILHASALAQYRAAWWALNPRLVHAKNQHQGVGAEGWCRVQVGRRESTWGFTAPTAD